METNIKEIGFDEKNKILKVKFKEPFKFINSPLLHPYFKMLPQTDTVYYQCDDESYEQFKKQIMEK